MSPDLGSFIQPDPIGFKGDASNLYRYCGNDWANRSDPMGLESVEPHLITSTLEQQKYRDWNSDHDRGAIMSQLINVGRINFRSAQDAFGVEVPKAIASGERFVQNGPGDPRKAPALPEGLREMKSATDKSAEAMHKDSDGYPYTVANGTAGQPYTKKGESLI